MDRPLLSIACITYNHEKFIEKAIEGFLMQATTFPFEIIIHDDASTDRTAEIVKKYADKFPEKITALFQRENQYSKGIKISPTFVWPRAKGKYLAICEGDDYWTDPQKIQKQVTFLESHPGYSVCYHDSAVVDIDNNLIRRSKLSNDQRRDYSGDELKKAFKVLPNTMCFRNVITEMPEEFCRAFGGDKFLTALLGAYGKGKYIGAIEPSVFRVHPGGINSGETDAHTKLNKHFSTRLALYQYYERIGEGAYARYFLFNGVHDTLIEMKKHYDATQGRALPDIASDDTHSRLVNRHYAGTNAGRYEQRRKNNPKWQFENDTLRDVLKRHQAEIYEIIDAPLGTGRFLPLYASLGAVVTVRGIDYSRDMLAIAAQAASDTQHVALVRKDIINEPLDVSGDLSVCFRFLNLVKWDKAAATLRNIFAATRRYAVFAIRTVSADYTGPVFIENKIHLHPENRLNVLIAECGFEKVRGYDFKDSRAGDYAVFLCRRKPLNVYANRINKNFRTVFTYGRGVPQGKIYQVENEAHARFIRDITRHPAICNHFPRTNRIDGNHVDAQWIEGQTVRPEDWQNVFAMLYKIQMTADAGPSEFDYVRDLVIPRFYRAAPIFGRFFCGRVAAAIRAGAANYDEKLSHPDMIPGNIVASADGYKIIDNELMCRSRYHRVDLLNALYNFGPAVNAGDVLRIFGVSAAEKEFLQSLWAARQIGSFLVKEKFQDVMDTYNAYRRGQNILPFTW